MTTTTTTSPPVPERLHALDAVRGFALLLGIVFHACASFIPSRVPIWPVEDSHRGVAMAVLFFATHVFRMTVFFLIAGFFAHMSFHRRGAVAFIGDRVKRIAVPLVVGWPILFASIAAVTIWAAFAANNGVPPKVDAWPRFPGFPLTHLWFLYVLLEFYAVVLILRSLVAAIDQSGRLRGGVDRLIAAVVNSALAPFILAAPVFTAFAADPSWLMWFGITGPENSLVTTPMA
jgi:glucans biosynthesis protein C